MSVVFSGSFSGRFVSTGQNTFIPLPSGVDFMETLNETVAYAGGAGSVYAGKWFFGDPQGQGTRFVKEATIGASVPGQFAANTGFFLQNNTINIPGGVTTLTQILGNTGAFSSPQILTTNTNGLPVTAVAGANNPAGIVRVYRVSGTAGAPTVGALQLQGIDFSVANVVSNTSMDLIYMAAITGTGTPVVTGSYAVIPFNPYFYPSTRVITKISQATQAIVTFSVQHFYTIGQKLRFHIPTVNSTKFGMTQLDNVEATIVAINVADADGSTNTVTIDVNTLAFTAFAWPLTTDGTFTPAMVVPIGENTATALNLGQNILADATVNQGQMGMLLVAGTASPAGVSTNVITWAAFKSFNGV